MQKRADRRCDADIMRLTHTMTPAVKTDVVRKLADEVAKIWSCAR